MEIIRACLNDLKEMNDLWNEVSLENGFYKPIDFELYQNKFLSYSDFSFDNVLLAKENNKLLGYIIVIIREKSKDAGFINSLLVKKEFRNKGLKINFIDTAGIHESEDEVEKIKAYAEFIHSQNIKLENCPSTTHSVISLMMY